MHRRLVSQGLSTLVFHNFKLLNWLTIETFCFVLYLDLVQTVRAHFLHVHLMVLAIWVQSACVTHIILLLFTVVFGLLIYWNWWYVAFIIILCSNTQFVPAIAFVGELANVVKRPDRLMRDVVHEMTSNDDRSTLILFILFSIFDLKQLVSVHFEQLFIVLLVFLFCLILF